MSSSPFFDIPWFVLGGLALIVALIFCFVWPRNKAPRDHTSVPYLILRWGHALVWVLLSISLFLRSAPDLTGAANILALVALGVYISFVSTLRRN